MIGHWQDSIRYANGSPAASIEVLVLRESDGEPAFLFSSEDGAAVDNPVLTDRMGNLEFFANQGFYYFEVNGGRVRIYVDALESGNVGSVHHQLNPSSQWTIPVSTTPRPPLVAVYVDGEEVMADVSYTPGNVIITFASPTVGDVVFI